MGIFGRLREAYDISLFHQKILVAKLSYNRKSRKVRGGGGAF